MHTRRPYHWANQETKELFSAIMQVKTIDEAQRFFRDLCTEEEIDEMMRRWQAVQMLARGKSYREIASQVELSTTTVARVSQWLHAGKGGYQLVLKRLHLI
jgi:TrpR-related protein YerC/YecD